MRPVVRVWVAALLLVAALSGVDRERVLKRLAPDLDPDFLTHLVDDDDAGFRAYVRVMGWGYIGVNHSRIDHVLWFSPDALYETRFQVLAPYLQRIGDAYEAVCQSRYLRDRLAYRAALGTRAIELNHYVRELDALLADHVSPADAMALRYRALHAAFERFGYRSALAVVEARLAREVAVQGRAAEAHRLLGSALATARDAGDDIMVCQLLGERSVDFESRGESDSSVACLLEGIARADRHRIGDQATRLRLFLAGHQASQGRLDLAAQSTHEAEIACRNLGGGPYEMRAVLYGIKSFAELGCWDIVDRELNRLQPLFRFARREWRENDLGTQTIYALQAGRYRAQLLTHQGRPAEAAAMLDSLLRVGRTTLDRDAVIRLLGDRADALLASGDDREALATADEALAQAERFHQGSFVTGLQLTRGAAALRMRDVALAETSLARARAHASDGGGAGPLSRTACDAFAARIALARGDAREARRRFDVGYRALGDSARRLEPGPRSQLGLFQVRSMRDIGRELLANDPAASLAFELSWRSLPGLFGRAPVGDVARNERWENDRTMLIVYGVTPRGLTRWCRQAGGTRADVIAHDPSTVDRLILAAVPMLARDPGSLDAPMPDSLRALLVELGRTLLPDEVRRDSSLRVVISAEGRLATLAFECLDVGAGDYEPLLARHDVIYARPTPVIAHPIHGATTALLLGADGADPLSVNGTPALGALETEAADVRRRLPGVEVYRGTMTPKRAVLDAWARASFVYVAAHLVRNPEAPFLCHFPLTAGLRPNHPEDAGLDLLDARTVDLSRCRLAVLSSCASGEPYVIGDRTAPSMADAFLDAGARAVMFTQWNVRDDRAAAVAPALASAWIHAGADPVAAWCRARRPALRTAAGWRHPFEWGAWSVTVGLPVAPWGRVSGVSAPAPAPALAARAPRAANGARSR
jgi:tetratricopeptide (TPR) repeat protein